MKVIYQQDSIKLDTKRITDETHPMFGDMTVFHDVVIASEIVQQYNDGMAFKPRDELEKYAPYVDGGWVVIGGHPQEGIVSETDQVAGRTVNVRYVKDLKDPATDRPCRAGIKADMQIFNNKIPPETLDDMKNGVKPDVSIGFFFSKDDTPGVVEADSCKGQEYDYVQRNMFHNHVAAGIDNGRCPSPLCGIGADEMRKLLMGDPFAGFEDFDDCVASVKSDNPDLTDEQAKKICGKLKSEEEDSILEAHLLVKAEKILKILLEDEFETLKGEALARKETDVGAFWRKIDWTTDESRAIFDSLADDVKALITEAGLCPDCEKKTLGADLSLEQIDEKLGELKTKRDAIREKMRAVEDKLYSETPEEKKRNADLRNQINQFWDEISDINDEIYAYGQAKSIKITESALREDVLESNPGFKLAEVVAEQECPEGMEWNAEQKACVEIANFSDRPENKLVPDEVFERYKKLSETP